MGWSAWALFFGVFRLVKVSRVSLGIWVFKVFRVLWV